MKERKKNERERSKSYSSPSTYLHRTNKIVITRSYVRIFPRTVDIFVYWVVYLEVVAAILPPHGLQQLSLKNHVWHTAPAAITKARICFSYKGHNHRFPLPVHEPRPN